MEIKEIAMKTVWWSCVCLLTLFTVLGIANTYFQYQMPKGSKIVVIMQVNNGFEIYDYANPEEVKHEFTKQNTDSMSLETLEWIYEGAE